MPKEGLKRKFTAILSADVEGYSRLMGSDEASTIHTLAAYKEAMTSNIMHNRGRVVDAPGDTHLKHSIAADRVKISQILINLLGNAVRYTQKGFVALRVTWVGGDGPHLIFEVEDSGPGVAAADLERIFDPFFQSDTGNPQHRGIGLGLAISASMHR